MKCKKHPPVVKVREGNVFRFKFAEPHRLWGELKERGIRQKSLAKAISIPIVTLNQYLLSYRPMPDSVEEAIVRAVNSGLVGEGNPPCPIRKTFKCYCDVLLFEEPGATVVCPGCFSKYEEGPEVEGVPATYDSRLQVLLAKEMRERHACPAAPTPAPDAVNRPAHYTQHPSGIECIQITEHMSFTMGNAMKYLWRADLKNGVEDLKKAIWYIQREIAKREKT